MAGDGVKNGRRGRKLKPASKVSAEEQEMVEKATVKSSKRSSSSRRSKKSGKVETAMMAFHEADEQILMAAMAEENVEEAAAEDAKADEAEERAAAIATTTAEEQAAIDTAVENGEYKTDLIQGDDAGDIIKIQDENFQKTGVDARGRVHECCDETELVADAMMRDALLNKAARQNILSIRMRLLKRLWLFRDEADCEDDYDNDEFHDTMRQLATIQRKLKTLDTKIGAMMNGAEQSSSDSEGDGEVDELRKLKNARQNLRYAMNPGTFPC
jgi:hypothetical protein